MEWLLNQTYHQFNKLLQNCKHLRQITSSYVNHAQFNIIAYQAKCIESILQTHIENTEELQGIKDALDLRLNQIQIELNKLDLVTNAQINQSEKIRAELALFSNMLKFDLDNALGERTSTQNTNLDAYFKTSSALAIKSTDRIEKLISHEVPVTYEPKQLELTTASSKNDKLTIAAFLAGLGTAIATLFGSIGDNIDNALSNAEWNKNLNFNSKDILAAIGFIIFISLSIKQFLQRKKITVDPEQPIGFAFFPKKAPAATLSVQVPDQQTVIKVQKNGENTVSVWQRFKKEQPQDEKTPLLNIHNRV